MFLPLSEGRRGEDEGRRGEEIRLSASARPGGAAPPPPNLHCSMISSKACRCSRSRRRSSAAMCRFHGGKPAARSPDAISAARREGAAGASARPARQRRPRGGGGGGQEHREAAGDRCPVRDGESSALSEPGLDLQPPPHARHGAAAALCQGPSPLSGARLWRQRLPRHRLAPPSRPPPLAPPPSPGSAAERSPCKPGTSLPHWADGRAPF